MIRYCVMIILSSLLFIITQLCLNGETSRNRIALSVKLEPDLSALTHVPESFTMLKEKKGELVYSRLRVDCIVQTRNLIWIMPT